MCLMGQRTENLKLINEGLPEGDIDGPRDVDGAEEGRNDGLPDGRLVVGDVVGATVGGNEG